MHTSIIRITGIVGSAVAALLFAPIFASAAMVTIQSLSPSASVISGTTVTFTATATGLTNPTYTVKDSFNGSSGTSLSASNMTSAGSFSWMPVYTDIGTHTLTITATDASSTVATVTQTIEVSLVAKVSILNVSPGTSLAVGQTLKFDVAAAGFAATSTTYTVGDSFPGTITKSNLNSSGNFTWIPSSSDVGTHKITIGASDAAGHSGNASVTINVTGSTGSTSSPQASSSQAGAQDTSTSTPGVLVLTAPLPAGDVTPGTTVTLSALAYGFSSPTFSIADSLKGSSITNANVAGGKFNWTPKTADLGTHTLTITAADLVGRSATSTVLITVSKTGVSGPSASTPTPPTTLPPTAPTPSASGTFVSYLKPGMTSTEVTLLQTVLTAQGYFSGSATGYFGPATEAALKKFQKANGLDALGVVGPSTRALLNKLASGSTGAVITTSGSSSIAEIEARIASLQAQISLLMQQLTTLIADVAKLKAAP